jgi:uncharacterized protein
VSAFQPAQRGTAVRFPVHVQPRAATAEVTGIHGDALRVRLRAPPVDGAANAELSELLGSSLGVPGRNVTLVSGTSARRKLVDVEGVTVADVVRLAEGADRLAQPRLTASD